jgi:hypothetical protein
LTPGPAEPTRSDEKGAAVYTVHRAEPPPHLADRWDDEPWRDVPSLPVAHFRPEGSAHRPRTRVKLVFDNEALYGLFRIADRFIRCVHSGFQAPVYKDSCVEFFVQPRPDRGYFNFEFNCGGALLASYITDSQRTEDGFAAWQPLRPEEGARIGVESSLPAIVEPEIRVPRTWQLAFRIPLDLLAAYGGPLTAPAGCVWRANFYKCGDATSHPHWAAWQPVTALNFHLPQCFGRLCFERPG